MCSVFTFVSIYKLIIALKLMYGIVWALGIQIFDQWQEVSIQVSLREMRRLTWIDTFCWGIRPLFQREWLKMHSITFIQCPIYGTQATETTYNYSSICVWVVVQFKGQWLEFHCGDIDLSDRPDLCLFICIIPWHWIDLFFAVSCRFSLSYDLLKKKKKTYGSKFYSRFHIRCNEEDHTLKYHQGPWNFFFLAKELSYVVPLYPCK